jgi:hypothetical protein
MDEGTCDYWAAVMLGSPDIWSWHRHHDETHRHPRSLLSPKTVADYDHSPDADPHVNGTIWAAALWDLRCRLAKAIPDSMRGERLADLLVLKSLLILGQIHKPDRPRTCRVRARFRRGLCALLEADGILTGGVWQHLILDTFAARHIGLRRSGEVAR